LSKAPHIPASEITPRTTYLRRREFLSSIGVALTALATGREALAAERLPIVRKTSTTDDPLTPYNAVTTYNNFYEFGIDKDAPSMFAGNLKTEPWTVAVEGECNKKAAWHLEDMLKGQTLEERIYRHRCVEAWSMVIPWNGFPLADFIKKCEPTPKAKFVEFTTLYDPKQMPGVRSPVLRWPYVEGLRLDEAMHPLTILAVGLYGEVVPNQNGAPLRLVVPWKYGFKGIKSIVRISLTDKEPPTTWKNANAREYGFYSNVNPAVDHPRWTQKQERRIGEFRRRPTLPFNGYGDEVASLYTGMDLTREF